VFTVCVERYTKLAGVPQEHGQETTGEPTMESKAIVPKKHKHKKRKQSEQSKEDTAAIVPKEQRQENTRESDESKTDTAAIVPKKHKHKKRKQSEQSKEDTSVIVPKEQRQDKTKESHESKADTVAIVPKDKQKNEHRQNDKCMPPVEFTTDSVTTVQPGDLAYQLFIALRHTFNLLYFLNFTYQFLSDFRLKNMLSNMNCLRNELVIAL
jgi:hypothetical protein